MELDPSIQAGPPDRPDLSRIPERQGPGPFGVVEVPEMVSSGSGTKVVVHEYDTTPAAVRAAMRLSGHASEDGPNTIEETRSVEYPVVPLHNDSAVDSMTEDQKKRVARFYELLANAMPLEGRDYRIEFRPLPDGVRVAATVVGLNDMGNAFAAQVSEYYRKFSPGKQEK